jgi:transposase
MNIQSAIEYCINKDSELEEAYHLLQELYKIARYSSFENAKQNILDWCDKVNNSEFNLEELKHVTLTYKSWINEIVNSFILDPITHKRLSNGFIEGKNNFCKTIKKIGFGYSDFDVFRYKIITTNKKAKQLKK